MAYVRVGAWTGVLSLAASGLAWGMDGASQASLHDSVATMLLAPVPTPIGLKVLGISALLAVAVGRLRSGRAGQGG